MEGIVWNQHLSRNFRKVSLKLMTESYCAEKFFTRETLKLSMCAENSTDNIQSNILAKNYRSRRKKIMYDLLCVLLHVSPVTCHVPTTLCSLSCNHSPGMLGDMAPPTASPRRGNQCLAVKNIQRSSERKEAKYNSWSLKPIIPLRV